MDKKEILADCIEANTSAFYFHISKGRYPTGAKIPPNDKRFKGTTVGGKDHQIDELKKNVERAYDWKLIQGTIINRMDLLPMAHCWCEATLEDIGGLWKRHSTLSGRFVFDFTQTKGQLFFQSVRQFNILSNIPPEKHELAWEGNEHHYHRFEYNPAEAEEIIQKNVGTWKFYEFDSKAIDTDVRS